MAKQLNDFLSEQSEQTQELKSQLAEQQRILESYKKDHGQLEIFFNAVMSSIKPIKPLPLA